MVVDHSEQLPSKPKVAVARESRAAEAKVSPCLVDGGLRLRGNLADCGMCVRCLAVTTKTSITAQGIVPPLPAQP